MNQTLRADLPASVRRRLLNLSRERGEDFNLTLTRYAIERLLYRLSRSEYANRFTLKGALLMALWMGQLHRPTRDLDLLGRGDRSQDTLAGLFRSLCTLEVEADGLIFHPQSVRVMAIREEQEYGGQRVQLVATLSKARITLQVDIGFGDVVTPAAGKVEYPTLLGFPAPRLRAYTQETVIAEKLQAMVILGMANSRMKDFYDVWMMSREFPFEGRMLAQAIKRTFGRRRTEIPRVAPIALMAEFALHPSKVTQWSAFLVRNRLDVGGVGFVQVVEDLNHFLMPILSAIADGLDFNQKWPHGGPWTE